jgi:hypothetical protein
MINKEEIFVNEKYWRNMSEIELSDFIEKIFQYYRTNGFPYYNLTKDERDKEFKKLMDFDISNICEDGIIKQTMHGLSLAWHYFPHSFNVKCNNKLTPYEAFHNDKIFKEVIRKRLKIGTYISDSGIRKMLKIYSGVQGVSNFRPTAAAYIYQKYAPNGMVWDMSGGWGGRLLGAIKANVDTYHCTEPSEKTYDGLSALANEYAKTKINYELCDLGSEEFLCDANSLDLCFTSPPYFDLEQYANESTQSYVKFNNKSEWIEGFLKRTFENCYYGLKPQKHMIINIADIKGKHNLNLEKETIRIAEEVGFKYIETLKLALSNINLRNKSEKFKYEPIFVFQK